jgi:molecular chaperone HtpG
MFITDDAKLLPDWLSFVTGIVDTEDLPLNVSREILQSTPVLDKIRKALVNRVLNELKTRAKDAEEFKKFQENYGEVLKHGLYDDTGHGAEIAALFRFESTQEASTTLDDYIARMKEGQEAIYYLAGDGGSLKDSPQLEGFKAKDYEVLLFPDPIDAFWPPRLEKYKDKPLKSASQANDLFAPAETGEDITALCTALGKTLAGKISDAVASTRLTGSPAMLVAAEHGPDLAMQRLLKRAGRPSFGLPPKLEINPAHPLILALAAKAKAEEDLAQDAILLLDLARLQEGDLPDNPAEFVKAIADALAKA